MSSKNKSVLWNFYDKSTDGGVCKLCKQNVKTSGNTTNLKNHIKRKHPSINVDKMSKMSRHSISMHSTTTSIHETDENVVSRPRSSISTSSCQSSNSKSVDVGSECSASEFSDSVLSVSTPSLSVCSSQSLKQPKIYDSFSDIRSYDVRGSKSQAITDAIVYMIAKDNMPLSTTEKPVKSKLVSIQFMSITADIWTDVINTNSFLELADTHTSSHISEWFEKLLTEWRICKDQVVTVVTDNGANILAAVKTTFDTHKHLPCFAHTLNLIDRFLLCSNHIASILINNPQGPSMLSATDIDIAREINLVLKPFEVATRELCGENYITGSTVIPLIHCLIKKCEQINVINPIALQLKSALLDNLNRWFGRMEEIQNLTIATILDPRFKTLHSNNPLASSKAIRTIRLKLADLKTNSSRSNKESSDDDTETADSLWSFHNELVSKKASENSEDNNERMPTDLKHFLNQPTIPIHENIIKFWDVHKMMYPNIAKIAQPYLSLFATSVPSERLFSKAGNNNEC
ncbi:uncharacterized protein LOC112690393 [Sipha flava]|uniref:Uncharacterized protein LOC112690393 n=1 Tax=Sipha flava TaxID=143950 RepID=A0A8B8GBU3_9HEMI|nr:uncharacterized protein LOC112690393 [Sipha flava]